MSESIDQAARRVHADYMRRHLREMALYVGVPLALLAQVDALTPEQRAALLAAYSHTGG